MKHVRAVCFGMGIIGGMVAREIIENKSWITIVGALDIDANKIGKDLSDLLELKGKSGVMISGSVHDVLTQSKPDIVVHTTSSRLAKVYPEILDIVEHGISVVSSCEELSYPQLGNIDLANKLDKVAKDKGVALLGAGINPGFVMDVLPLVLTAPCLEVRRISVTRQIDSSQRRIPFQKKIGIGLSRREFKNSISLGTISGHIGLRESIAMIAEGLGWSLNKISVGDPKPLFSDRELSSGLGKLKVGMVVGMSQTAKGLIGKSWAIRQKFVARAEIEDQSDLVEIQGRPSFSVRIRPGINGDQGTVGMLINSIPKILSAPPGLHSLKDLRTPSAFLPHS